MVWKITACCGRDDNDKPMIKTERTTWKQKLSYGVGHVFNDLCIQTWFSYLLLYFTKVVKMSAVGAGYVFLASQVADAVSTPFVGYACDKSFSRRISAKYGKKKIWHLLGSVGMALVWPFMFSPCLVCEPDSAPWVSVAYYSSLAALFSVCWPLVEISHLSLMPLVAKRAKDAVVLSALRSGFKLGCGVYIYIVTWILLEQDSERDVGAGVQRSFTYQTLVVIITGCLFSFLFHLGVEEPLEDEQKASFPPLPPRRFPYQDPEKLALEEEVFRKEEQEKGKEQVQKKTWKAWVKNPDFYKIVIVYMTTQNVLNLTQSYFPMYLAETMHFEKEAVAYFPLTILICGIIGSSMVKRLNKYFSDRIVFCAGCVIVIGSATWYYFQPTDYKHVLYVPTIIMGFGNSMMLVTSLAMVADMIGDDKESSGFVYAVMAFVDKASLGLIVLGLQENYPVSDGPTCIPCEDYLRASFAVFPGVEAMLAFLLVAFLYRRPATAKEPERIEIEEDKDLLEQKLKDIRTTDV